MDRAVFNDAQAVELRDPDLGWSPAPGWVWYNGLDDAREARQPKFPSLIVTGQPDLLAFTSLDGLAVQVAELLAGRAPIFVRSVGTYAGYDSFPAWSVQALPHPGGEPGDNGGPPACAYVCSIAIQRVKIADFEAAVLAAQAERRAA